MRTLPQLYRSIWLGTDSYAKERSRRASPRYPAQATGNGAGALVGAGRGYLVGSSYSRPCPRGGPVGILERCGGLAVRTPRRVPPISQRNLDMVRPALRI